jgi:hypothetical protein
MCRFIHLASIEGFGRFALCSSFNLVFSNSASMIALALGKKSEEASEAPPCSGSR